jgi:hypothetical protein
MRPQLAEDPCPLAHPIAQDARHGRGRVVVQDRLRHLAEECKRGVVPVAKRFGGLRRIGLHKAGIAVRQVHREEVDLAFDPGDLRQCLAKIHLRMSSYWLRVFDFGCSVKYSIGRVDTRNPRRTPITVGSGCSVTRGRSAVG